MKSRTKIRIDFNQAKKEAKKLDGIAEKLQKQASGNLESSMRGLSLAWSGENSRVFLKKEEAIKAKMLETASDLRAVAADIRRVAQELYEAEMRAYEIAVSRKKK